MNYMGGKHRQGPAIAKMVQKVLKPNDHYFEPFCGAMGSAHQVAKILPTGVTMNLSDVNVSLIEMWKSVLAGWTPPDVVSNDEYDRIKAIRDPNDPMTAYCGYGMSFGGKWFGGYARNGVGTNYELNASRSALLKASVLLKASPYDQIDGIGVWCLDPPYAGRTKAHGVKFDHVKFWDWTRNLVNEGNRVLVTEFVAPKDFVPVHSWGDTVTRHYSSKGADGTNECIFVHESQASLFGT
jgi:DNA adenine methylase